MNISEELRDVAKDLMNCADELETKNYGNVMVSMNMSMDSTHSTYTIEINRPTW